MAKLTSGLDVAFNLKKRALNRAPVCFINGYARGVGLQTL